GVAGGVDLGKRVGPERAQLRLAHQRRRRAGREQHRAPGARGAGRALGALPDHAAELVQVQREAPGSALADQVDLPGPAQQSLSESSAWTRSPGAPRSRMTTRPWWWAMPSPPLESASTSSSATTRLTTLPAPAPARLGPARAGSWAQRALPSSRAPRPARPRA